MELNEIKEAASKILGSIGTDGDKISKFKADPAAAIKEILGVDIGAAQVKEIVALVEAKLAETGIEKKAKDVFGKIKGLFDK